MITEQDVLDAAYTLERSGFFVDSTFAEFEAVVSAVWLAASAARCQVAAERCQEAVSLVAHRLRVTGWTGADAVEFARDLNWTREMEDLRLGRR